MEHAKILKAFLDSKGIRQSFVADRIHMNRATLSNILNGKACLKSEVLEAVCLAIGSTPADFFAFKLNEYESKAS